MFYRLFESSCSGRKSGPWPCSCWSCYRSVYITVWGFKTRKDGILDRLTTCRVRLEQKVIIVGEEEARNLGLCSEIFTVHLSRTVQQLFCDREIENDVFCKRQTEILGLILNYFCLISLATTEDLKWEKCWVRMWTFSWVIASRSVLLATNKKLVDLLITR